MCGINGFNFKDEKLIQKMNRKIHHRGPDDQGFYIAENISLGHQRLSIIDLSERGRQPIFNENKSLIIIFNGEIYNYQELKKGLVKRHKFYTQTDTEVIIHLYEELGPECLQKLNGIFAFAIWNKNKQELFLARDRIGVKPIYYYYKNNKFIFSSEIKAILEHQDIKPQVNLESFNHYFNLGFVPQPLTMFQNIYKLPSAHYLVLHCHPNILNEIPKRVRDDNRNVIEIKKYWQIKDYQDIKSKFEIQKQIDYLINDSIKHQLISDRPTGIFLSGGIDSNIVLGVAKKYLTNKIKTYSVGFEQKHGDKFNSDFELAKLSSNYHQTDHHQLIINEKDVIQNLEDIVYHLDEPINNATQTAIYLLAKKAKQDVAVVLSGSGGDELFMGYPRYYFNYLIDKWQKLKLGFKTQLALLKFLDKIIKRNLTTKFSAKGLERYKQFMFRKTDDIKKVLKPDVWQSEVTNKFYQERFGSWLTNHLNGGLTKNFSMIDLQTWLLDLDLIMNDKITMAWGLEQRVPLLDHRLVELSVKIPTQFKIKTTLGLKLQSKYILKQAMKKYIAPQVFNQPKRGFFSPASKWLRAGLYDFSKQILSKDYCKTSQNFFDFKQVDHIFEDHVHKKKYNLVLVWGLLMWQMWYKRFID